MAAMKRGATVENVVKHSVRRGQKAEKDRLLAKTGGACEGCDVTLPDPELLHVHHVVPVGRGGTNAHYNVTLVCPNCHAIAHWYDRTLGETARPVGRLELIVLLRTGPEALARCRQATG